MAQVTSHQFVYNCETCNGVACYDAGRQQWKHLNRGSICPELAVVAVPLVKVTVAAHVDTVALAA